MLFNSLEFAIFLPIVFGLYWLIARFIHPNRTVPIQNFLIVAASYVFYGWWNYKFLSLIVFSTVLDYGIGIALSNQDDSSKRKILLWLSIAVNLGFLGVFKYYNFFLESFIDAFSLLGVKISASSLQIVLPVGISFYTFQTLSYTIDVYKGKLTPSRDFLAFAAFVSFFPQLVAGPIERASNLLPQFLQKRKFSYDRAVNGLRQILWGLFKKIVIADNFAEYANLIFNNSEDYSGSTLALGALCFAFQIYGDFSGYSDIAIGTSRLFGFDLKQNFAFPYFSRDIAEFWRRWHISLSTWFRDYLYIPLGGSRMGTWGKIRNTLIIFVVSGFWHGANWTFILWGLLNALYFIPSLLRNKNRVHLGEVASGRYFPSGKEFFSILGTFSITVLAWVFFRAENAGHAFAYLFDLFAGILNPTSYAQSYDVLKSMGFDFILIFFLFMGIEWMGRQGQFAIDHFALNWNKSLRLLFYYAIALSLFLYGGQEQQFIYFQF